MPEIIYRTIPVSIATKLKVISAMKKGESYDQFILKLLKKK